MVVHPLRLSPGADLRNSLDAAFAELGTGAAFVLQGIGSLSVARLRFAGREAPTMLTGDFEILGLAGSLSADGAHLHMSVADADGRVSGGHVAPGCRVRTTAEVLIVALPQHVFAREHDAATGFAELVVRVKTLRPPGAFP